MITSINTGVVLTDFILLATRDSHRRLVCAELPNLRRVSLWNYWKVYGTYRGVSIDEMREMMKLFFGNEELEIEFSKPFRLN